MKLLIITLVTILLQSAYANSYVINNKVFVQYDSLIEQIKGQVKSISSIEEIMIYEEENPLSDNTRHILYFEATVNGEYDEFECFVSIGLPNPFSKTRNIFLVKCGGFAYVLANKNIKIKAKDYSPKAYQDDRTIID